MANADAPYGMRPYRHLAGGVIRPNTGGQYTLSSGYATAIFYGDLVTRQSTSQYLAVGSAADTAFLGVFAGVEYTNTLGEVKFSRHWPASTSATNIKCFVYDDPNIIFRIKHNGTGAITDYGAMADIAYTAGSTTTGVSKMEINTTNIGTGINLKIMGLIQSPDNAEGANSEIEVMINEHELRGVMTSV